MTGLGAMYLMMATHGSATDEEPQPKAQTNTIFKMCQGDCMEQTPHELKAGYSQCVICGNKIFIKSITERDA